MREDEFKAYLAAFLILRKGDEVLLLRRANTGYEDGNYAFVAGHSNGHETIQEAVVREAKEEVGIDVKVSDLRVVHVQHSPAKTKPGEYICIFTEATKWEGEPSVMEPDKCSGVAWFSIGALPENMIPMEREAFELAQKGVFYSNSGWKRAVSS